MDCLIIKKEHLDKILRSEDPKTLELRGRRTKKVGWIGLIQSGSGKITAIARLIGCKKIEYKDFKSMYDEHKYDDSLRPIKYKKLYGWKFDEVRILNEPIPYKHPKGAIIWVKVSIIGQKLIETTTSWSNHENK